MAKNTKWKSRLLKVPAPIIRKLRGFGEADIVVAAVKKISEADIDSGVYAHLGIKGGPNGVAFPARVLPNALNGGWSRINLEGKEIVRRDLPKYKKTFAVETPNFGDAVTYGTHIMWFDRDVYPRDFIAPKHLEIRIDKIDEEDTSVGKAHVFKFVVDEVLRVGSADFQKDLFYNLNILQENVGVVDVYKSDAGLEAYLATVVVDWEILPVGRREENLKKILSGVNNNRLRGVVRERYEVLERLKPKTIIRGVGGFQRYFGAQFADELVVFENVEYGNAVYVMFEDWKTLSKKSRVELLRGDRNGFERIAHTDGWKTQLEFVIDEHRRR